MVPMVSTVDTLFIEQTWPLGTVKREGEGGKSDLFCNVFLIFFYNKIMVAYLVECH